MRLRCWRGQWQEPLPQLSNDVLAKKQRSGRSFLFGRLHVELQTYSGQVVPGYERNKCVLLNVDGIRVPLEWTGTHGQPPAGTRVKLRIFFRDATVYAFGLG